MAAPYKKKSLLEMSDREREARRLADLRRPGRDAIEGVYPEQFIIPVAKTARGAIEGAKSVGKRVVRAIDTAMRPKVQNEVVRPTGSGILVGRVPARPEDVTHAYRKMSKREIEDIKASGYARRDPHPELTKRDWSPDKKWWSAGDEQGVFGRDWIRREAEIARTKIEKVPSKRAVKRKDIEILDSETGKYKPLNKEGLVSGKKKTKEKQGTTKAKLK